MTDKKIPFMRRVFASGFLLTVSLVPLRGQTAAEAAEAAAFARAQQAEKAGDYRAAEQIYQHVLSEHPGQMAAELNLGLAYYLDRRYAHSSAHLLRALRVKPDLFPALMVSGVDFMKLGDPQRAVLFLRRARNLSPANEYVNYNLASAEYLAGDYGQACAEYARLLRLPGRQKDVSAWYGLGEVSLLLAQQASAQIGKLPVSNPYRLRMLAVFYRDQHEWGLALARLKQLEAQPDWQDWSRLRMAEIDLHQGNLAQATAEFRRAASAKLVSSRAHFGLGVSLFLQGKTGAALPELQAASSDPWLFAHPELLESQAGGHKIEFEGLRGVKSKSALVNTFLAAASHPNSDHGNAQRAAFYEAYEEAIRRAHEGNEEQMREMLSAHPSSEKLLQLAADFLEEGDKEAASDALTHGGVRPEAAPRSILQARVKAAQGDALGTVGLLLTLLDAKKGNASLPEADWWVSNLFRRAAELALDQVLAIAPNSVDAHLLKAQMDDARSRTDEAIHEFRMAVQAAPDDPNTHFRLGEALWRAGHFQEAISALREGLRMDPRNSAACYQIGDSYLNLAQPARALPFLAEAVKQNSELDAAYKDLAMIYLNEGNIHRSVALLQKIAARDADGSAHYLLFQAYLRLGNKAEAAACLKRFQELKAAAQKQDLSHAALALGQEAKAPVSDK